MTMREEKWAEEKLKETQILKENEKTKVAPTALEGRITAAH